MNSTKLLTVYKNLKELVCEASDLDNFTDRKVYFQSHKTGKIALFELMDTETDQEGEVLCWRLRATNTSLVCSPELNNWTLVVLND